MEIKNGTALLKHKNESRRVKNIFFYVYIIDVIKENVDSIDPQAVAPMRGKHEEVFYSFLLG
jgi:hypothetical protein